MEQFCTFPRKLYYLNHLITLFSLKKYWLLQPFCDKFQSHTADLYSIDYYFTSEFQLLLAYNRPLLLVQVCIDIRATLWIFLARDID